MSTRHWLLVAAVTLAGACTRSPKPDKTGGTRPSATPSPVKPAGVVTITSEATGRNHALVLENGTGHALSLRREIIVEQQEGGIWSPIDAALLYLRESCANPDKSIYEPPACVDIAAGVTFRASPWTDSIGESQCYCEECGPAGAGTYRFVVETCDKSARYTSAGFAVEADR